MIRAFLEKRRVRRVFEKFVDSKHVETLLRDGIERQPLKQGHIEFVLAFVRGESPAKVAEQVGRIADLAVTHGATIHSLTGSLAIVAFGTHPALSSEPDSRLRLVQALRQQLAEDVKIVHGAATGHCGLFGSEKCMSYTFLVPQFDRVLGALSRLEFGESKEFTP